MSCARAQNARQNEINYANSVNNGQRMERGMGARRLRGKCGFRLFY